MKIFFVGIHNKPKMQPLDSSTRSGKVIDKIIEAFPANECIKTNLCDIEKMPEWTDIPNHKMISDYKSINTGRAAVGAAISQRIKYLEEVKMEIESFKP